VNILRLIARVHYANSKKGIEPNGYDVYLEIAKNTYVNWWSSPPNSVDHINIQYATNRYGALRTGKRLCDFKRLWRQIDWNIVDNASVYVSE